VRRGWAGWIPAAIWAAVLFFVSQQPTLGVDLSGGLDNVAHFAAYLVMGMHLAAGRGTPVRIGRTIFYGAAYGFLDELHQSFVPGRDSSLWDLMADTLGVTVGVLMFVWIRRHDLRSRKNLAASHAETTPT
jgi:hypothetical protein